jgi:hypothetical protein
VGIITKEKLHPQAQLSTGSASSDPVQRRMKLRNGRHRSNAFSTELRQLLSLRRVNVDKAIHVANAESLHAI